MADTMDDPLKRALEEWLPECDVGIMAHGFLPHGRDYFFVIENPLGPNSGTYRLTFTHVPELNYRTRVQVDTWKASWDDVFTDYQAWLDQGEPAGYVWGANWSLAYPGISTDAGSVTAWQWANRLGKPMHELSLETDRYLIEFVFHDLRIEKLSNEAPVTSKVVIPFD